MNAKYPASRSVLDNDLKCEQSEMDKEQTDMPHCVNISNNNNKDGKQTRLTKHTSYEGRIPSVQCEETHK